MPVFCSDYAHLVQRAELIKAKFLASQLVEEAGDMLTFVPDLDLLAAYRLLLHAEFEYFLEQKALATTKEIRSRISGAARWHRDFPQLLSLCLIDSHVLEGRGGLTRDSFEGAVQRILQNAEATIRENNGIKAGAFQRLSLIAGKTLDEVDETVSSMLNSYGKERGDVAHQTVSKARSLQTPSTELLNVNSIIRELGTYFDVKAEA